MVAHNAGEDWRRRDMIKHAGVIKVVIGPTIDTRGKTAVEIKKIAEQWMKETMNEITTLKSANNDNVELSKINSKEKV